MNALMTAPELPSDRQAKRVRFIFETDLEIRQAIEMRAQAVGRRRRRKIHGSDIVNEILRRELAEEIREILTTEPEPDPAPQSLPPSSRKQRGRPKKGD